MIFNPQRLPLSLLRDCTRWLQERKCKTLYGEEEGKFLGKEELVYNPSDSVDFVLSLGGDGTLLRAASIIKGKATILGVNLGGLGFLTKVNVEELFNVLEKVLKKEIGEEERVMLQVQVDKGEPLFALNDVVVSKLWTKACKFTVRVDAECVASYKADGVIIATPTGSTAYSLSAGGPIIHGCAKVFAIVPICPHTTSLRPLIIPSEEKVRVEAEAEGKILVSVDGRSNMEFSERVDVQIQKAPFVARLFSAGHSFYKTLGEKLNWPCKE
jgi:NAD+ kinase